MAWALVKDGNVTTVYNRPKAITLDGIQHPANIFTVWNKATKKAHGIYDYNLVGANVDNRFYTKGGSITVVDNDAGTVTVTYSKNNKELADTTEKVITKEAVDEVPAVLYANGDIQTAAIPAVEEESYLKVTAKGLKSQKKEQVKQQAASLLQGSDWYVVRAAEGGAAVPDAVATYRAAVRTKSGEMETAIDNAADMDAFVALHNSTGSVDDGDFVEAVLNDWPVVPDILK